MREGKKRAIQTGLYPLNFTNVWISKIYESDNVNYKMNIARSSLPFSYRMNFKHRQSGICKTLWSKPKDA